MKGSRQLIDRAADVRWQQKGATVADRNPLEDLVAGRAANDIWRCGMRRTDAVNA